MQIQKYLFKLKGNSELCCPRCGSYKFVTLPLYSLISNIQLHCRDCQLSGDIISVAMTIRNISEMQACKLFKPGGEFNDIISDQGLSWEEWLNIRNSKNLIQKELDDYLTAGNKFLFDTSTGIEMLDKVFSDFIVEADADRLNSVTDISCTALEIPASLSRIIPKQDNTILFPYRVAGIITHIYALAVKTGKVTIVNIYKDSLGVYRYDDVVKCDRTIIAESPVHASVLAYNYAIGRSDILPVTHSITNKLPSVLKQDVNYISTKDYPVNPIHLINYIAATKNNTVKVINTYKLLGQSDWKSICKSIKYHRISALHWLIAHINSLYKANRVSEINKISYSTIIPYYTQEVMRKIAKKMEIDDEVLDYLLTTNIPRESIVTSRYTIAAVNNKTYLLNNGEKWIADFTMSVHSNVYANDFTGFEITIKSEGFQPITFILKDSDTKNKKTFIQAIKKAYAKQYNIAWWEDCTSLKGMSWSEIINAYAKGKPIRRLTTRLGILENNTIVLPKVTYIKNDKKIKRLATEAIDVEPYIETLYDRLEPVSVKEYPLCKKLFESTKTEDVLMSSIITHIFETIATTIWASHPDVPEFEAEHFFIAIPDFSWIEVFKNTHSLLSTVPAIPQLPITAGGINSLFKRYKPLGSMPISVFIPKQTDTKLLNNLTTVSIPLIGLGLYDTIKRIDANPRASFCTHSVRQKSCIDPMLYKDLTDELSSLLFQLIKINHTKSLSAFSPPSLRGREHICKIIDASMLSKATLEISNYPQLQVNSCSDLLNLDPVKVALDKKGRTKVKEKIQS